jgi:hypothetical protein
MTLTNKYPKDWKKIAARAGERAGGRVNGAEWGTENSIRASVAESFPSKSSKTEFLCLIRLEFVFDCSVVKLPAYPVEVSVRVKTVDRYSLPSIASGMPFYRARDMLYHTFASWYMMNGGDLYELAKILSHSNIKMKERCAKLARQHIARTSGTARGTLEDP